MEPWQIAVVVALVLAAAVVAYAVLRRKKAPPPGERLPGRKEEKEETTEKLRKEVLEKARREKKPPLTVPEKEEEAEIEAAQEVVERKEEPAKPERPGKPTPEEVERLERKRREEELARAAAERIMPIRKGLQKTRGGFISKLKKLMRGKREIGPELLEEIEELCITSDIGVKTTQKFIEFVKDNLSRKELTDSGKVWDYIREEAWRILNVEFKPPEVKPGDVYTIMVVGVNGVGKTTTIGKLASRYKQEGKKVVMAAADTFRAAAVSQLEVWGRRVGCEVVKGKEGADPSSVVFDAIDKARADKADMVIADTAGRLHTKIPLMDELKKVKKVMGKAQPGAPHELVLVLDATTGQNGVAQAKSFLESLEITGIILTKLDGTAKGGVILSICNDMNIPVRYIGIGEAVDDLKDFNAGEFVSALFDEVSDKEIAA
jgi:fused signal recognition particle receptor